MRVSSLASPRIVGLVAGLAALAATPGLAHAAATTRADNGVAGQRVTVHLPDGATKSVWGGPIYTTIDGHQLSALCVEIGVSYTTGTYPVDVAPRDMAADDHRAIAWIINARTPARWTAPATGPAPGAAHAGLVAGVAVWAMTGNIRAADPTTSAGLNAEVAALIAEARARTAEPARLALTTTPPADGATAADLQVAGRPGAVVALTIPAGDGTLSAASVTLDASGAATVRLTRLDAGTSTVVATAEGDGVLEDVRTTQVRSQHQVVARPSTLSRSLPVTFRGAPTLTTPALPSTPIPSADPAPAPAPDPAPVASPATSAPAAATAAGPARQTQAAATRATRLRLITRGPARARAGERLNYLVFVTNTGTRPARDVRVTDVLSAGLVPRRPSHGRARRTTLSWSLGTLAPGATRRIVVPVQAAAGVAGRRAHTVRATARGAATVTSRGTTLFAGHRGASAMPAVAG